MAKTKPLSYLTSESIDIVAATGVFVVCYGGKEMNMRHLGGKQIKYGRVAFMNEGHALNLAKKLNKLFDTDLFTVRVAVFA